MYGSPYKIGLGERDVFRMMLTKVGDLHPGDGIINSSSAPSCGTMVVGMMCYAFSLIRRGTILT